MNQPSNATRVRRGFTLIEMLVVVAILLLLITILTPELERALDMQQMVYCQFNMKNIGLATVAYSMDSDRHVPGPNWRRDDAHGWLYYDPIPNGLPGGMDNFEGLETGDLWPYLLDHSVYRCIADRTDFNKVPNRPNNSRMITSYCMNGSVIRYGGRDFNTVSIGNDGRKHNYWDTYRITLFKPRDVLYWEPDENKAGGWWWDGANYPWEGVTRRHVFNKNAKDASATNDEAQYNFGHTSVSNADGSAEWMTIKEFYSYVYVDWLAGSGHVPTPTRLWNTPNDTNGR